MRIKNKYKIKRTATLVFSQFSSLLIRKEENRYGGKCNGFWEKDVKRNENKKNQAFSLVVWLIAETKAERKNNFIQIWIHNLCKSLLHTHTKQFLFKSNWKIHRKYVQKSRAAPVTVTEPSVLLVFLVQYKLLLGFVVFCFISSMLTDYVYLKEK